MNICGYLKESIVDGEGIRSVIFVSGCYHACPGCHNPSSWDPAYGESFTIEKQMEIIRDIQKNPLLKGLTISGGDPFFSAKDVISFVTLVREHIPGINIWIYSGFTIEQLFKHPIHRELLQLCDVLVDGPFKMEERDISIPFRGSRNQNVIDIKRYIASR